MTEEAATKNDVAAQAEEELHKKGRDGAYLEINLAAPPDLGDIEQARMVVISGYRLELSEPDQVEALRLAARAYAADIILSKMDISQAWVYIFRKVFEAGLKKTMEGVDTPKAV